MIFGRVVSATVSPLPGAMGDYQVVARDYLRSMKYPVCLMATQTLVTEKQGGFRRFKGRKSGSKYVPIDTITIDFVYSTIVV